MSDTINDNMGEIADEMGIPAYQQFFFNDRLLGKENTITSPELHITRNSTIVLVVKRYHRNDTYIYVKAQNGVKWRVDVLLGDTIKSLKKILKNKIM